MKTENKMTLQVAIASIVFGVIIYMANMFMVKTKYDVFFVAVCSFAGGAYWAASQIIECIKKILEKNIS